MLLTLSLVVVLGLLAGVASMFVYWAISPQSRLAELKARAAEARTELRRADGSDFEVVWALSKRAVGLALRQIVLTAGPTVVAVGLVLAAAWAADALLGLSSQSFPGPAWAAAAGHAAFWVPMCVAALAVKLRFHIQ